MRIAASQSVGDRWAQVYWHEHNDSPSAPSSSFMFISWRVWMRCTRCRVILIVKTQVDPLWPESARATPRHALEKIREPCAPLLHGPRTRPMSNSVSVIQLQLCTAVE